MQAVNAKETGNTTHTARKGSIHLFRMFWLPQSKMARPYSPITAILLSHWQSP
jgi:hypothetical protein